MPLSAEQQKITEFIVTVGDDITDKMTMDFSVNPPLLIYKDGEKFVALDPAGHKFFADPGYFFGYDYNFSADSTIQNKVDKWGRAVFEKAKVDYMSKWLETL